MGNVSLENFYPIFFQFFAAAAVVVASGDGGAAVARALVAAGIWGFYRVFVLVLLFALLWLLLLPLVLWMLTVGGTSVAVTMRITCLLLSSPRGLT